MHIFQAAPWGSCGHILGVLISFFLLILPVPEPCLNACQQKLWGSFSAYYEIYFEG
jgi:hypothetical protein